MALALDDDLKGLRSIEIASGITVDSILRVIPQARMDATLIHCSDRGVFSPDPEERRPMKLQVKDYRTSADHPSSRSFNTSKTRDIEEEKSFKDWERDSDPAMSAVPDRVIQMLSPALDIWSNYTGERQGEYLGDEGWALAMVTGFQAMTLTLDELSRILHVGERQVRRIVRKLETQRWASRNKEGRRVLVTVDFSVMIHEDIVELYDRGARRARKTVIHQKESYVLRHFGTQLGRQVRSMWQNRAREALMYRDWAQDTGSRCWDSMIKILEWSGKPHRWEGEYALLKDIEPLTA